MNLLSMKNTIQNSKPSLLIGICLLALSHTSWAISTKITVNGMVCAFCAQGIEKRLLALPATQAVWVDLKQKFVLVQAKEGMTLDEKSLRSQIADAGYEAVRFEQEAHTIAQMRATQQGEKK